MIHLTREQVRQIDRLAVERYHIPGVVLMENAAIAAAGVAVRMIEASGRGPVLVLCGGGNNGGDGLAVARHLHNRQFEVRIFLTADPQKYSGEAKINWEIVQAMGLSVTQADPDMIARQRPMLIVDAIFGTGLAGPPREPFGAIVAAIEQMLCPCWPSTFPAAWIATPVSHWGRLASPPGIPLRSWRKKRASPRRRPNGISAK